MKALDILKRAKKYNANITDKEIDDAIKELEDLKDKTFTRVEVISKEGRVFSDRCSDNRFYELSIQDDCKTLKIFERSK